MSVDLRTAPVREWGLDAGNHQDGWDPYAGLSSHWNHKDGNEGDLDYDLEMLCLLTFKMVRVNNHLSAGQISMLPATAQSLVWKKNNIVCG
ncbi:hypothetical protein EDB19DRAFT_1732089 [Suillus lakei]|nr:hypothetical protein EDB19DRAFT_1732089 [Suillus lakei]